MTEHMTQHERIMRFLNRRTKDGKHYVLTPMKAFQKLNITKLSTRIGELIVLGARIYKIPVCKKKKDGTVVRYMSYTLDKPEDNDGGIHKDLSQTA